MIDSAAFPRFADDLGGFVSRLRTRLFTTQEKAAQHFGLKSHGTISRYESEILRPPLGYVATLVVLYVARLESEGQPPELCREHFLREVNRLIRQRYSWDEEPFLNWQELCAVADQFKSQRQEGNLRSLTVESPTELSDASALDDASLSQTLKVFLGDLLNLKTLTFLLGDLDKQRELRNRQAMLKLVNDFWIKGVLENSLYNSVLLELGLEERRDAVEHPWGMVVQTRKEQAYPLPPGTRILDVFTKMGQALLILGDPGAGKTTMLLDLARDLLTLAEQDPTQPMPVVFNLSSWTDPAQPLSAWLIEELQAKYRIPKRIASAWLEKDELLPLLDGLDEVAPERREACVRAINCFHQEYLVPLVVCSRVADYTALATRLKLQGVVLLQPLTQTQIESYFSRLGPKFNTAWSMLQVDVSLQELAQTPLILGIIALSWQEILPEHPLSPKSLETRRRLLFETYVARMFERKGEDHKPYPDNQAKYWLAWLARQMSRHSQTIFLIEQMQPSWLSSTVWQWTYLLISRLITALFVNLGILLSIGFLGGMPLLLIFTLLVGPIAALMDGVRLIGFNKKTISHANISAWQSIVHVAKIGLAIFLGIGLLACLTVPASPARNEVLIRGGLAHSVVAGLIFGLQGNRQTLTTEIQPAERLNWLWRGTMGGSLKGLAAGLVFGVLGGLIYGLGIGSSDVQTDGLIFGLVGLLSGFMFGGMSQVSIEKKNSPGQGIYLSFRNALFSGVLFGLIGGIAFWMVQWLSLELHTRATLSVAIMARGAGPVFVGFSIATLTALCYGGQDVINHLTLRVLLIAKGYMPAKYPHFLDYAANRIFLRKVGGGYVFIHRLLLDYFASLELNK